jgi:bacteriorhodopsin
MTTEMGMGAELFTNPSSLNSIVAFTFFIGTMAMMGATAFFWLEMRNIQEKWRTSLLISGLITFIAAVHYYYMRGFYMETQESPTFFRYVDWLLTVPLMAVEFYLITKKAGAKLNLLWKLIAASVAMLVLGYIGEGIYKDETQSWVWGALSGVAYFYIVYLIWFGEVARLADASGGAVKKANRILAWFVLVGWAIYPLGYIFGTEGGLFGADLGVDAAFMEVIYNIGDAVNKIGFGLVIYALAVSDTKTEKAIA